MAENNSFAIPGIVKLDKGEGNLDRIVISSPLADAEIYLNGAHLTRWQPKGQQPVLFMSSASQFHQGKPIRGGVPIIFPWFGGMKDHPEAPAHGVARTSLWTIVSTHARPDGNVAVTLQTKSSEATQLLWPYSYQLDLALLIGSTLRMELKVTNTGAGAFKFEEAMHTYFVVGDITTTKVTGLGGVKFIDKVDGFKTKTQAEGPIVITGETDRVYLATKGTCVIEDSSLGRQIRISKENSDATVVWNPWIAKAKAMADFGDDEWPGMICVETCNVAEHAITLEPKASHIMSALIGLS